MIPQAGPQEKFLGSAADIVIFGGAAGGGKTYALLLECARHVGVRGFGAVIFRRESTQITNEGGLWDSAMDVYPSIGGRPFRAPKLGFSFGGRSKITFGHLNQESDVLNWQGSQIPLLCFDELVHFEQSQFFYMLSRNRSTCGVRPYVRATCNPDADSWVVGLIDWWIGEDGYPIKERSGVLRWMTRVNGQIVWRDKPPPPEQADDWKSITFIPSKISDNPALILKDPGYLANLKAMTRVDRARLLDGNWKIRPAAGLYFPRHDVSVLPVAPTDITFVVRGWDLAATPPGENDANPDGTASVKMGLRSNGRVVVLHAMQMQVAAYSVRQAVRNIASQDGHEVRISMPQDPGQAGKEQAQSYATWLSGYSVQFRRPTGDKIVRAEPFASQWQAGNVDLVDGPWVAEFLDHMEAFPDKSVRDDLVDASSDAYNAITGRMTSEFLLFGHEAQTSTLQQIAAPHAVVGLPDGVCGRCVSCQDSFCHERGLAVAERDHGCDLFIEGS